MRAGTQFSLSLSAFLILFLVYGIFRLRLGIDFTDEGAFVAMPLRMLFGEKPFTADLLSLTRPIEAYLFILFKLHPSMTLYEFRLFGWGLHLLSYAALSIYLFRVSTAPFASPLIASIPLFVCHIFGLASPSYNTLSSDFLLMTLCFRGLAFSSGGGGRLSLHVAAGLSLFIATFSHPALLLVAAAILAQEFFTYGLAKNLIHRRLTASNIGLLVFVACWISFLVYMIGSGALEHWVQRLPLARSFTNSINDPFPFFFALGSYPFSHSYVAMAVSLLTIGVILAQRCFSRAKAKENMDPLAAALALLLVISLVVTFRYEPDRLPTCFAQASLILILATCIFFRDFIPTGETEMRFLMLMSGLGALLYATFTYFFSPHRSWISGILALPFAFAMGLTLLLKIQNKPTQLLRLLACCSLVVALVCVGWDHYRSIQRDAAPPSLTSEFKIPKLHHIKSTEERVLALNELYAYMRPKLTRGEALLGFDDCPMLYFLFDAMPAYGLTRALTYAVSPDALRQLDEEFRAKPLPNYAVRTLIDLSNPVWNTSRRTDYSNYPLNETVMAHYVLERTIFPFEVWRLKTLSAP